MPAESIVRWPAEWEPQAATWLAWPHNCETWPGHYENIPNTFVQFLRAISQVQPVHLLSGPTEIPPSAMATISKLSNVAVHHVRTNDTWIRDYGPTFVVRIADSKLVGIRWRFNAWGGKYLPCDDDAAAAAAICGIVGCDCVSSELHCEGGALETDGCGTLLTNSSCLLTDTRNPGWTRTHIEDQFKQNLGAKKIIWVDGGGLDGDDTDGHIDQLARFVSPGRVVVATSSHSNDSNARGLRANAQILRASTDANHRPLEVIPLPTPAPRWVDGKRVPESYCNFLIANEIVILPTFRSPPTDQYATKLLSELMPDRTVIPLDAYDFIWGLGAFHCASQQQPREID